jgi:hypothetical protein
VDNNPPTTRIASKAPHGGQRAGERKSDRASGTCRWQAEYPQLRRSFKTLLNHISG